MNPSQRVALVILIIATVTIIFAIVLAIRVDRHDPCLEDQPCWNWETMGNRCTGDDTSTTLCVN